MKKVITILMILATASFVIFASVGSVQAHDYTVHTKPIYVEMTEIPDTRTPMADIPRVRTSSYIDLSQEDMELLELIAMAEAEGEDAKGKALVMRVVLNRCLDTAESVSEVVYKPKQFAVSRMFIEPTEDCHEALNMILDGWDESEGALYFNAHHYSKYGDPLFVYGGHYFSR